MIVSVAIAEMIQVACDTGEAPPLADLERAQKAAVALEEVAATQRTAIERLTRALDFAVNGWACHTEARITAAVLIIEALKMADELADAARAEQDREDSRHTCNERPREDEE